MSTILLRFFFFRTNLNQEKKTFETAFSGKQHQVLTTHGAATHDKKYHFHVNLSNLNRCDGDTQSFHYRNVFYFGDVVAGATTYKLQQ